MLEESGLRTDNVRDVRKAQYWREVVGHGKLEVGVESVEELDVGIVHDD